MRLLILLFNMLDDGPIIFLLIKERVEKSRNNFESNTRVGLVTSEGGNWKASQSGTRGGLVTTDH